MPLTDAAIRAAKPREKPYKLSDTHGLYLLVRPNGGRYWRLKFRFRGTERLFAVGVYPEVSLKEARDRQYQARKLLDAGKDPVAEKKAEQAAEVGKSTTFAMVAAEWLAKQPLSPVTMAKAKWMIEDLLNPYIGKKPIAELKAPDVLVALRALEARGKIETAHRVKWRAAQVVDYAVASGLAPYNPVRNLRGALQAVKVEHHAAITEPRKVGELLRAVWGYSGQPSTEYALKILPYVFVRPGELRAATWAEFDLDAAEWRIPAARMKVREPHIVPLAHQVVKLLRGLEPITGAGKFLFPAIGPGGRCISENTLNGALRRLGYSSDVHTPHGFRTTASTMLNELGHPPDLIELQLAHKDSSVRAVYNRSARLADRKKLMQTWADYLEKLRLENHKRLAP